MKIKTMVFFTGLLLSLVIHAQSTAANAAQSEALKYLSVQPEVKVFVHQTDNYITSPMSISIKISNLTDSNMSISKVETDFPEMLLGRVFANPIEVRLPNNKDLDSGNAIIATYSFKPGVSRWYFPFLNLGMLFFKPGEYEARVTVTYKLFDRNDTMIEEKVAIKLEPPFSSIIWGSVLGSFLLALFITLYKRKQDSSNFPLKEALSQIFWISSTGIVSGIIIIFLLVRFKDLDLPMTVTVNDFFGGMVIGLFTYKLGAWLYTKLTDLSTPLPEPPKGEGE
jgi:hypothetical protein